MNSIIWKGVPSTDIKGLLICELPPITKPEMRVKETVIDGRDGSIIEELGYSAYEKTVAIGLHGEYDINEVIKYFTGEGDLVFSNEPDKVYTAKISGRIDYNRLVRFRQASITFKVQPFKYKYNELFSETQTATASGTNLVLKDSGNTPIKITTEADKVIVHGKNIINPLGFSIHSNTKFEVFDEGYTIVATGGSQGMYVHSRYDLPIELKGKKYTLKCDSITSEQNTGVVVQVSSITPRGTEYCVLSALSPSKEFTIPVDATAISLGVYTNNKDEKLTTDNVVVVKGMRLVPNEFNADAWCEYSPIQTIEVVDGVATAKGYEPATVISNADNVEMTADYFKPFEVVNEGLEDSKPLMILKGSGTVEISVNGVSNFTYTFPEGENEVHIDSEKEDAHMGTMLKNRNMNGEFPILTPQTNKISWSGDVESIEVLPRSRWL